MNYDLLAVTLNPSLDRQIIIDNFKSGEIYKITNTSNQVSEPGGKAINASLMLASLGINTLNIGFVGGYIGKEIQSYMGNIKEITTNFIYTDQETRTSIEIIDTINDKFTTINTSGPFISEENYNYFLNRYKASLSLTDKVLISGSIPPGIPSDAYSKLSSIAKKMNKTVYMEASGYFLDKAVIENCPHVVRVDMRTSNTVLGKTLDTLDDYIEIAEAIINNGAKLVIMSYHISGDVIATKDGIWMFTATDKIEKSHLFGAGDAFMSGIIFYNIRNRVENWLETAKFGMASAISSTRYIGKILGDMQEIEHDLNAFTVEKLK